MIIDMLTHIGSRKGETYTFESLLQTMDKFDVEKCMICSQLETIDNEYIRDCCLKYPQRTLGFAVVNPWDMEGEDQLEKCFFDYKFYGLKLNAIRFGYSADRQSLLGPFFKLCNKYQKCVVVHGQSDIFSLPDKWALMARTYPDVPIILFHIGVPLMYDRACQLAAELPNFYLSTCGSYVPAIKMAYEIAGAKKILFSSDCPFGDMAQEIEKIKYVINNKKDRELIFSENAKNILKI